MMTNQTKVSAIWVFLFNATQIVHKLCWIVKQYNYFLIGNLIIIIVSDQTQIVIQE